MKAVLFDAFGTLVEIIDKRNPFAAAGATRDVMTHNRDLEHYTDDRQLHRDLIAELQSITLYSDVLPTLARLRTQGIKVGVVSNLARPYGEEVMRILGGHVDLLHYSYLEGCLKPDPQFFLSACRKLAVEPDETMMVGDNYKNDFLGATDAGLNAAMIVRPTDRLDNIV